MTGLYSKITKVLFWKAKETKWIIMTATVIIVMVSMVFSVAHNISNSFQQTITNMVIPFDIVVQGVKQEEVERVISLSSQEDTDILAMISTGNFVFTLQENDFVLNVLAASDQLDEMYNIKTDNGAFPKNPDEIILDSRINEVSSKNYQIGDTITVDAYVESSAAIEELELKIVGFFDTPNGSGFELYGYMNLDAGIQLSSLLGREPARDIFLKLSHSNLDNVNSLGERLLPEFEGRIAPNAAKYNIMYEEESCLVICNVFNYLGYIVVVISALLFNGVFRLNILNVKKRIGLLRCMGLNKQQLLFGLGLNSLYFISGYALFSLPLYILCTNLFGAAFFQSALDGYNMSPEVSIIWSFSMKPYVYSLISVAIVTTGVYAKLLYNVLKDKPLTLIRCAEQIKAPKVRQKKAKNIIALIGKRNLLRSKSRTFILGSVFFLVSCLLLVTVITSVTIDFSGFRALKRGQEFDYEFYTNYYEDAWIDEKYIDKIKHLPCVESLYTGSIRFADFFKSSQITDINKDKVGIIIYSDEMLARTCEKNNLSYDMAQTNPKYYIYTHESKNYDTVSLWDANSGQKNIPVSGKIDDAIYSYYKVDETSFMIITNEAGAKELYGSIKNNFFFVTLRDRTNALEQINQILKDNAANVYYNDLKEFNNDALEELHSILFMIGYIAACICFMVIINIVCNVTINIITREQELGILAAMGMPTKKIIHLLIYEVTTVLGSGIIWSLPISFMLCTFFELGIGQKCNYIQMLLTAMLCVLAMYAACYLICYSVGAYLLKNKITKTLNEE